ncbi:unnamed protein product, partial [Amoebophrya sp. A25]|eukprot:GSA25T00012838001.1
MKKKKMAFGIRGLIFAATALSLAQGALGLDTAVRRSGPVVDS